MKITPQTYIDMNKEFEEEDMPFRIIVPTQEEIDEWESQPPSVYEEPEPVDMVAQEWAKIGVYTMEQREEYRKNH